MSKSNFLVVTVSQMRHPQANSPCLALVVYRILFSGLDLSDVFGVLQAVGQGTTNCDLQCIPG